MKTSKTKLLVLLCMVATITVANAQTVTGGGTTDNLTKWVCPSGICVGTTEVANSLLKDNGTTISLGNYSATSPSGYMMHLYEDNVSGSHTIGLDVELFNKATTLGGESKGLVSNVQGSNINYGIDAYAANGTNSCGGNFAANSSQYSFGVKSSSQANNTSGSESTGGYFTSTNSYKNRGITTIATGSSQTLLNHGVYAEAYYGTNWNHAVEGRAYAAQSSHNVALYGYASAPSNHNGLNYGTFGRATNAGSTGSNIGIYGDVIGGNSASSWAGYFVGHSSHPSGNYSPNAGFFNGALVTTAPGTFALSDQKFKENIKTLDNALELIMQLSSKTYTFKGKDQYPSFNFSRGKQYGFLAQEIEKVIPEVIHEAVNPAIYDDSGKKITEEVSFKAVNYTGLIPILTTAIQEQQTMIVLRDKQIATLEERIKRLEAASNNTGINTNNNSNTDDLLYQNTPNPFNGVTEIRYRIPQSYTDANIMIFDMNGKKIKSIAVQGAQGSVSVSASEMAAGLYLYSLIIDGREIATKRMVVNK